MFDVVETTTSCAKVVRDGAKEEDEEEDVSLRDDDDDDVVVVHASERADYYVLPRDVPLCLFRVRVDDDTNTNINSFDDYGTKDEDIAKKAQTRRRWKRRFVFVGCGAEVSESCVSTTNDDEGHFINSWAFSTSKMEAMRVELVAVALGNKESVSQARFIPGGERREGRDLKRGRKSRERAERFGVGRERR